MLIYPIDLSDFNRKYIVLINVHLTMEYIVASFLDKSKVDPKKYAGKMLSDILLNFFNEHEDLQYVYENFYIKEYDSFEDYLFKKMLIDKDEIDYLFSQKSGDEKLYFVDLKNTGTNNDENLFRYEDVDFLEKINEKLREIE